MRIARFAAVSAPVGGLRARRFAYGLDTIALRVIALRPMAETPTAERIPIRRERGRATFPTRIDVAVREWIEAHAEPGESFNDTLRRLLGVEAAS